MCRIRIVEAAPIGSDQFDRSLRRNRPYDHGLIAALQCVGGHTRVQRLNGSLRDHEERHDKADRQKNAGYEADEVAIEIAEVRAAVSHREGANPGHRHDKACRGRREHRKGDATHLAEIRQRRNLPP